MIYKTFFDKGDKPSFEIRPLTADLLDKMARHIPRNKPMPVIAEMEEERLNDVSFMQHSDNVSSGRKPSVLDNTDLVELMHNVEFEDAMTMWPVLEDILHGVCRLDLGGNTRPLRKGILYSLLSSCPTLSTAEIMSVCGFKERQGRYYLTACRIAQRVVRNWRRSNNKA